MVTRWTSRGWWPIWKTPSLRPRRRTRVLEPELVSVPDAKTYTALYAKLSRLSSFGVTAFAHKQDAADLARVTGTSMGKAKDMAATSEVLATSRPLDSALRKGEVSLDQATEIARAEEASPGSAKRTS